MSGGSSFTYSDRGEPDMPKPPGPCCPQCGSVVRFNPCCGRAAAFEGLLKAKDKILSELRERNEQLESLVYHTKPGEMEFAGEGWTWQQQSRANEDRLKEAEARADSFETMAQLCISLREILDFSPNTELFLYPNGDSYGIRLIVDDPGDEHPAKCKYRRIGSDLLAMVRELGEWCEQRRKEKL